MRIHALLFAALLLVCAGCNGGLRTPDGVSAAARVETGDRWLGEPEVLAERLNTVWGIDFLPGGQLVLTERPGWVSVLEDGARRTIGSIAVHERGEGGLHGIAVDPDFSQNRHVYIYYTHNTANRVSRFTLGEDLSLGGESILLDGIPRARIHNGGRLRFGPDGMLYITTGDAGEEQLAQDRNSLAGKILRVHKDGSIPEDNPFGNAVWAYGLRNSQGLDWHPQTGELYAASHGPRRRDEVNRIERGGNYGWPQTCDQSGDFIPAARCYTEFTLAPCGAAFSGNNLFVAGLRGTQVRLLQVQGNEVVHEEELLPDLGRIREVVVRDNWLYVGTSNRDGGGNPAGADDRILRYRLN